MTNHTLLQGILRSGITAEQAAEKYKLNINRHNKYPNLVQFKYDQIESDLGDRLVQQCRGIIMDEANNWNIVARPFDKFFNYGEQHAAEIDWSTARVLEKLDGTCIIMYYYDGWQVATLGSADASGPVGGFKWLPFSKLFWDTFTDKGYKVPEAMWQEVTFIWELTGPYNRVVVDHRKPDVTLIGARIANGNESSIGMCGYQIAKSYNLATMADLQKSFARMQPTEQEGYVVVDGNYNRIKVKHPGYVRIHLMKGSFTLRNIVDCVRHGEPIELLNYFPEHVEVVTTVKDSFFKLISDCTDMYDLVKDIKDKKEFAMQVKDLPYSGVLFAVHNGKRDSVVHALQEMQIDALINLLEKDPHDISTDAKAS